MDLVTLGMVIKLAKSSIPVTDIIYKYSGSVNTYKDLKQKNLSEDDAGQVYNVIDTGINYAWTGSEWDALGLTLDHISYNDLQDKPVIIELEEAINETFTTPSGWQELAVYYNHDGFFLQNEKIKVEINDYFVGEYDFLDINSDLNFTSCNIPIKRSGIDYGNIIIHLREDLYDYMTNPRYILEVNFDNYTGPTVSSFSYYLYKIKRLDNSYISKETWKQVQDQIQSAIAAYDTEAMALLGEDGESE